MCSIIGYHGAKDAAPILVRGLKRMEYRGYDSVGVATHDGGSIQVRRGTGRVNEVNQRAGLDSLSGRTGIGHTRWATHGKVTDANAHPHPSDSGEVAIVHNGVIDNFGEIKAELQGEGYGFKSETDSEVIANLLQKHYQSLGDAKAAVLKTASRLKGHYSFVAMFAGGQLAAVKHHRPLVMGLRGTEFFLSSDVLGFVEHTDDAVYIENGSVVIFDAGKFEITDFEGTPVRYDITKVSKEFGDAYKGDYAHFTLKEICEQPDTIPRAGARTCDAIKDTAARMARAGSTYVTGSGTSYNSALIAKQLFARHAKVEAVIASELRFAPYRMEEGSVLVAISQSGESADVLDAVGIAKKSGCHIVAIVNIMTSTLAREADVTIGMNCGPEIGVAATKSFTSQLAILHRMAAEMGGESGMDWEGVSASVGGILDGRAGIEEIAGRLGGISDIYVLGRGMHHPIAMEASLKLKELAYIHAEGMAGGELKHGPLALMDEDAFVIVINPTDSTHPDTLTTAREIRARGAKIIGVSDSASDVYDYYIRVPKAPDAQYPMLEIIALQLLSYYAALEKETDPDHPRNLAKSVTVK